MRQKENNPWVLIFDASFLMCFFVTIFLILSFFYRPFVYLSFLIAAGMIPFVPVHMIYQFLLYFFSFAVVFKTAPGATSLFTYLELLCVLILGLRLLKANRTVLILLLLLLGLTLVYLPSVTQMIKFVVGIILYYFFTEFYRKQDAAGYFKYFVCGLLISTFVGIWKTKLSSIAAFYTDYNLESYNGRKIMRFCGLFTDPNYFCIPLILCIEVIMIYVLRQKKSSFFWKTALIGVITAGCFTLSKSFYILAILLCGYLIISVRGHAKMVIGVISAIFAFVWINPGQVLNKILYRFTEYEFSTGRFDIWKGYLEAISDSIPHALLGHGINAAAIDRVAHNIYIEMLYYIGAVGLILYLALVVFISVYKCEQIRRNIFNYLGFLTVAAQYCFLCGIFTYEIPFFVMICYLIFNNDFIHGEDLCQNRICIEGEKVR